MHVQRQGAKRSLLLPECRLAMDIVIIQFLPVGGAAMLRYAAQLCIQAGSPPLTAMVGLNWRPSACPLRGI